MKLFFRSVFLLGMVSLSACSAREEAASSGSLAVTADAEEDAGTAAPVTAPQPKFVAVTANGSGCPAGSWTAQVADEGLVVRFSAFEAGVEPGQLLAVKDCQLSIQVDAPAGVSYAVSKLNFSATEALDAEGMTARQTVKHYFQGDPTAAVDHERDISGPTAPDPYHMEDRIDESEAVWSPCGAARDLQVMVRLMVRNNPDKTGTGKLTVPATWTLRASGLRVRVCS